MVVPHVPPSAVPARVHILGVGGVGLSGVALLLAERGCQVTGSDLRDSPLVAKVRAAGVEVDLRPRPDWARSAQWVVTPWGIAPTHTEVAAATRCGVRVMQREQVLRVLFAQTPCVGVVGTVSRGAGTLALASLLITGNTIAGHLAGALPADGGPHARLGEPMVLELDERAALPDMLAALLVTDLERDDGSYYAHDVRARLLSSCSARGFACVLPDGDGFALFDGPAMAERGRLSWETELDAFATRCLLRAPGGELAAFTVPALRVQARGVAAAAAFALLTGRRAWHDIAAAHAEAPPQWVNSARIVGQADIRASGPLVVHDVRTHPIALARVVAELEAHANARPHVIVRPFPHSFAASSAHSWQQALRPACCVSILPPYPGGGGDEDAHLEAWLRAGGIDATRASEDMVRRRAPVAGQPTLFSGGDDMGVLADDVAALRTPPPARSPNPTTPEEMH